VNTISSVFEGFTPSPISIVVLAEIHSVAVAILLISNLWINLNIGGSTPSSVRDSVIAVSTLLKAPSWHRGDQCVFLDTERFLDAAYHQVCCASDICVGSI